MSCRVLKRGVENLLLDKIVDLAKEINFNKIVGEYIPTKKNLLVKDHYLNLGFVFKKELWELNVSKYDNKEHFINNIMTVV